MLKSYTLIDYKQPVRHAVAEMLNSGSRYILAVDEDRLIGILTGGDIVRLILRQCSLDALVYQVINPNYLFIKTDDCPSKALEIMKERNVLVVPQIDSHRHLVEVFDIWMFLP